MPDNETEIENNTTPAIAIPKTIAAETDAEEYVFIALEKLNLNYEDCQSSFIREKVMPYDTDKSIVVIPKISHKEDENFFIMDANIVVIDHLTHEIVYRYHKSDAWTSDAMQLTDITIDTAPYRLNPSTRAFGIRVSYMGSSRVFPFSETVISLFIPKEDRLVKILDNYPVSLFRGENDMSCVGYSEWTENILMISNRQTNGYNNIISKSTIKTTSYSKINEDDPDCLEKESTEYETDTLYFEDGKYNFVRKGL